MTTNQTDFLSNQRVPVQNRGGVKKIDKVAYQD